ncbi:MAG TPA: DUF6364 family protein [Bryobacteraceae bacterium]|nr:DUF6364 family protein [Bryobacteraceae bacterium]
MRTTIDLDEALLRTAKALAAANNQTLSQVVSDLVRKGLRPEPVTYSMKNGFPILAGSPSDEPVTPDQIKDLLLEKQAEDGLWR